MEIKTVSVIGLGALGVLFGHMLSQAMAPEDLRIIADSNRIDRYQRDGIFCNGTPCRFNFVTPADQCPPADLIIIAVKFNDLDDAVRAIRNHVGPDTIILSLLNGISSEEIIGRTYGMDKLLLCVAQGMDAVKVGNALTYQNTGLLSFGSLKAGDISDKVKAVERFFVSTGLPHEVVKDMPKRLWSKFMLNVGANQTSAVYRCNYAGIQEGGEFREVMIAAMREVVLLSEKENIGLSEEDVEYWLNILDSLNPLGKTSMQQDVEARRRSELEMFAGTVLELGRKHSLDLPVNNVFYKKLKALESTY